MKKMPLPSPRSPQSLDKTILDYAQKNVPAKKSSFGKPLWISGLATASIIGIAVIISQPKHTSYTPQAETAAFSTGLAHDEAAPPRPTSKIARAERSMPESLATQKLQSHTLQAMSAPLVRVEAQLSDADASAASSIELNTDEVKIQLQELSALLDKGESIRAEAAYAALKQRCSNCELPDTLAAALEKRTDTTAPPTP